MSKIDEAIQDVYDAPPVTAQGYAMAARFLECVPLQFPQPEIGVDPDGEVSFDWFTGADDVFSVSVSEAGRVSWAALRDGVKEHGECYLPGTRVVNGE